MPQHTKLQFYVLVKALLTSVPKDNAIGKEGYNAENIFKMYFVLILEESLAKIG